MPTFNLRAREVCLKIVFVGPGLGGKTTNIEQLHQHLPERVVSDLKLVKTEEDRTLFFDFFALDLPDINGLKTRISIYGVPGQPYYRATRRAALAGVDGLVFVADSQASREDDNLAALKDIHELLEERGYDSDEMPIVFQWNKRDLPDLSTPARLNELLNQRGAPFFEAIAINNEGVTETFKAAVKLVTMKIQAAGGAISSGG
jgi:signal recognition particle receptor subunit beta